MGGINFHEVKKLVTMEDLLAHYSVVVKCQNPAKRQFTGSCPLPTHPGKAGNSSFNVNFEKNAWKCWVPGCAEGGVLDFVMKMEGCNAYIAATKILEWFGVKKQKAPLGTEPLVEKESNEQSQNTTLHPRLQVVKREPKRKPVWAEKSPAENISNGAKTGQQPVQPKSSSLEQPVKRPMQEVDAWFDALIVRGNESDAEYWQRVRNGVKKRLIENWRNGQKAAKEVKTA